VSGVRQGFTWLRVCVWGQAGFDMEPLSDDGSMSPPTIRSPDLSSLARTSELLFLWNGLQVEWSAGNSRAKGFLMCTNI
jgi:hypothetical protein